MSDLAGPTIRFFLLGLALLALSACNLHFDLDAVEATATAGDAAHDATSRPDSPDAPGSDASDADAALDADDAARPDAADAQNDADGGGGDADAADVEVDVGRVLETTCDDDQGLARNCEGDFGSVEGECDPLGCDQCVPDQTCMLRLRFSGGVPDAFVASCLDDAGVGSGLPGDACSSATDCGPRTLCVNWEAPDTRGRICSRLCELETGRGCPAGFVCTNPLDDTLSGLGFCTRTCDPSNAASCPTGLTCAYDPGFPDQSCLREFRCLDNGGFSGKSQGDACDASMLHLDGCPNGLICVPDPGGDTCQTICSSGNECGGGSCLGSPGGINTCQ